MLWILLASQLSLPLPVGGLDVWAIFSPDDMPADVQIAGINRFVGTRTTVGPTGALQDCKIENASGNPQLDIETCAIILRRAKVRPAQWIDGSPTYGVLRFPVSWVIGEPPSRKEINKAFAADIELFVANLPKRARGRANVELMIATDEAGRVVDCAAAPSIFRQQRKTFFPELVPVACEQVTRQFKANPARDTTGKAVRSVQTASVSFQQN